MGYAFGERGGGGEKPFLCSDDKEMGWSELYFLHNIICRQLRPIRIRKDE